MNQWTKHTKKNHQNKNTEVNKKNNQSRVKLSKVIIIKL